MSGEDTGQEGGVSNVYNQNGALFIENRNQDPDNAITIGNCLFVSTFATRFHARLKRFLNI